MCKLFFKKRKNFFKGFTLAEILVTLAIIGIIASLTIPSLLQRYDEKQLNTRWKKEYTIALQAFRSLISKEINIDFTDSTTLRADFKKVLSIVKEDTWANLSGLSYAYYKTSSGTENATSSWTDASALMMDGSIWRFNVISSDCTADSTAIGVATADLEGICAQIAIDINGTKEPNEYGKDLFFIHIIKQGKGGDYQVYPYGSQNDGQTCSNPSDSANTSRGCSAEALIKTADEMP